MHRSSSTGTSTNPHALFLQMASTAQSGVDPVHPDLTALQQLAPLPKPLHSWPIGYGGSPAPGFRALLVAYARVARAIPIGVNETTKEEVAAAVSIAAEARANLTLQFSPWYTYWRRGLPPTHTGQEEVLDIAYTRARFANVSRSPPLGPVPRTPGPIHQINRIAERGPAVNSIVHGEGG